MSTSPRLPTACPIEQLHRLRKSVLAIDPDARHSHELVDSLRATLLLLEVVFRELDTPPPAVCMKGAEVTALTAEIAELRELNAKAQVHNTKAAFQLNLLKEAVRAMGDRPADSRELNYALQAIARLFAIVLSDPTDSVEKPPLGLAPEYTRPKQTTLGRTREIVEAVHRYSANGFAVPVEWVGELVEKVEQLEKTEAARPKWIYMWPEPNGISRDHIDSEAMILNFPRALTDNEMNSLLDMAKYHAQLVRDKRPEAPSPVTLSKGDDVVMLTAKLAELRELIAEAHDEFKFTLENGYRAGKEGAPRVHRLVAKLAAQKQLAKPRHGSAFSTMSFPLPADHWLYAPACERRDNKRDVLADLPHPILDRGYSPFVGDAARWAIRAATMRGQDMDFDPDALVQNFVHALCGPGASVVKARNTGLNPTASSPVAPE